MIDTPTSIKDGALYIRVSTDKQEELSPDAQKRLLLDYAKKNDIFIDQAHIYIESGISGRHADKRPIFQQMIATAKEKPRPFDVILVWKFSRFARNQDESAFYKSILRKKCNVDIVSITEPIMEGMYGRLIEMIIEWSDEFYSYNLAQEVCRGMGEKALRGGYQSTPCLGYQAVGGGNPFVINEREYKIVQYIFDQYDINYLDPTGIARKANGLGYHTKRGNPFEKRSIENILRNPFYIGEVTWNGITFHGEHETRLDPDRYHKRIARLNSEFRPKKRRSVSVCAHWLSGIVKCPICGASLGYNRAGRDGNNSFFYCWKYAKGSHDGSVSITEKKLIRHVIKYFEDILDGSDFEYKHRPLIAPAKESELKLLQDELARLDTREKRVRLAYENEIDTLEEYKENRARIQSDREELQKTIDAHDKNTKSKTISKKEALDQIQNVYNVINNPEIDYQTKGVLLRSIVEKIVYDKSNQKLVFYLYFS